MTMPDEYKPMIYNNPSWSHSGNYSLFLNYRGIYAMPEFDGDVSGLQMSFFLRQAQSKYKLQVGVMSDLSDASSFVPVTTITNGSSGVEPVSVDFSSYTGTGRYIAFRNILPSGYSGNYSYNFIDDISLEIRPASCTAITDLPYTENFDSYTTSTSAKTGVEPPCWTLAHQDVTMPDEYKPMIYNNPSWSHSGNYSLFLNYRGIYAMPEFNGDVSGLQMSFFLRQAQSKYKLQVGVMSDLSDASSFVPVTTITNGSSGVEPVSVDFSSYTGTGRYIAFSPPTRALDATSPSATSCLRVTRATTATTSSTTSVSKPAAPYIPTSSPTPTTSTPTLPPPQQRQVWRFPAGLSHTRMSP